MKESVKSKFSSKLQFKPKSTPCCKVIGPKSKVNNLGFEDFAAAVDD